MCSFSARVLVWKHSLQLLLLAMSIMQKQYEYKNYVCIDVNAWNNCCLYHFSPESSRDLEKGNDYEII